MLTGKFLFISCLIMLAASQVTKVTRTNPLLSRKKRYLTFPMNSNFVITLSYIKAIMVAQPRGWNALGECDVPFALPSDTRIFKNNVKAPEMQKREVLRNLESVFSQKGFHGEACVKRMICEIWKYRDMEEKSLVRDIMTAAFLSSENNSNMADYCDTNLLTQCDISFFT